MWRHVERCAKPTCVCPRDRKAVRENNPASMYKRDDPLEGETFGGLKQALAKYGIEAIDKKEV